MVGAKAMTLWLSALIAIATASRPASVEIRLTGYVIESVRADFETGETWGPCMDVVRTKEWVEVTAC
jgi:hypothetical protein